MEGVLSAVRAAGMEGKVTLACNDLGNNVAREIASGNIAGGGAQMPYDQGVAEIKEGLIDPSTIIIDAKSGTSGAGRKPFVPSSPSPVWIARFTDILVQPARKRNEYSAFCSMVDSADIPEHSKVIFFGDRGYTSYNNFAHVIEKGQYFLIRCNDKRASGMMGYPVDTLPAFDEDISLILTRSKAVSKYSRPELFSSYRYIYQNAPMDYLNDQRTEYDLNEDGQFHSHLPQIYFYTDYAKSAKNGCICFLNQIHFLSA